MADDISGATIQLPVPCTSGVVSVEETLARRRSLREFAAEPLSLVELSQLLWAAHGITEPREGFRTVPSAGALYPLEIYLALADGFYHHNPRRHSLRRQQKHDLRQQMAWVALHQAAVATAPAVLVFCAVFKRTSRTYGRDAQRYVPMEVGHAAQNVLLQAVALGLGGVPIGAFHEEQMHALLGLPADHSPLYLIPVGRPQA